MSRSTLRQYRSIPLAVSCSVVDPVTLLVVSCYRGSDSLTMSQSGSQYVMDAVMPDSFPSIHNQVSPYKRGAPPARYLVFKVPLRMTPRLSGCH
ncbi:hypothetical protein SKAU_G00324050 [Synaphobranchus kaupii]|uniref:Uncharacterized protein n=1 Tax=Synaphobranchus kaupii TaxID=118154 RepID=A0A9Q1EPA7_SYNKA|nr:hypothetical protein SKAU_G00324050 [Synaphobranchus kaupii]